MTIETIKAIIAQGAQAFTDGKKSHDNPYVNNPEHHMHWITGFNAAAMEAPATEQVQQVQLPEEAPAEEAPAEEAKPAKASKTKE